MKLLQHVVVAEPDTVGAGGRSLVVGVKLDSHSRELLTWALVKVAQPGDIVIALHVLGNDAVVDRNGKSSLLSVVKAFDSVLAVYEGFCNLKQVDLKLKICRGTSAQKVIVREANSYNATNVVVGTACNHHKIRSSTSVAKYCAKNLSKDCWVFAVKNGKVVFQSSSTKNIRAQGIEEGGGNGFLDALHRSLSNSSQILNADNNAIGCVKENIDLPSKNLIKQSCKICSQASALPTHTVDQSLRKFVGDGVERENSLAMVPVQKLEEGSTSIRILIKDLPGLKPGWPLLRHSDRSLGRRDSDISLVRKISVVQWAMKLPTRCPYRGTSNQNQNQNQTSSDSFPNLERNSGAIVPVGLEPVSSPHFPDQNSTVLPKELDDLHKKHSSTCRLFKYQELLRATSNFFADNLIGKGGSSQVYRGCLPDGKKIAVKILKSYEEVLKEFVLEIEIITALHHKNIISLLGFCYEHNKLMLVYDFLSRGSLEDNLHCELNSNGPINICSLKSGNRKDSSAFGWSERYKVALGVAEALAYLHDDRVQPVIHRDVKSSNVLLSEDFEPQLSDFGLAKLGSTSSAPITCTDVAGTFGYLAPEYFMHGKVNYKIDVYAFGVVLLELVSGRKPICTDYPKGQESLVMWAKPILNSGKVSQLLDPRLGCNYNKDQMERLVLAACLCIRRAPQARPQMSLVLKLLRGDVEVTKWARLQVDAVDESGMLDDETFPRCCLQSHLNLALLDVEDDSLSLSSIEQTISLEDYLRGRWSRSSSLDKPNRLEIDSTSS